MDRRFTLKTLLCGSTAFLGAFPGLASAQSTAWNDVVKAAEKEGVVSLYVSVAPAQVDAIIVGFEKAYPKIRLEAFRNSDSVISQKMRQELSINADGADLIFATKNNFFDELLSKSALVKPDIPALVGMPPSMYFEGIVPVVSKLPLLVAYNTNMVKTNPRNYEDFTRPEFDGALGVPVVDGSPITTAWWDFLRTTYPGYWERIAKLKPRVYASSVPLAQAVASGEVAATILASPGAVAALINRGAPVKMVAPDKVYGMDLMVGLMKASRRPNAARVLANYLFSNEGQTAINGGGLGIAIRPNIPGAMPAMSIIASDPRVETPEKLKKVVADWKTTFNR